MKTRVGKIARLPYETREQLNLRLLNGQLGSPLLKWLNELPETKELVDAFFGGKLITKQNLSEWRRGGYEDWLRHQHRQENFRQMNEQGEELQDDEGTGNLFENFSRLVLAEMAEDLNTLHKITDRDKRWSRLREISRDLARLQHSYSHCRKTELSRQKWEYETGSDDQANEDEVPENTSPSLVARASCLCESKLRPPTTDAHLGDEPARCSAAVPAASSGGVPPPVHGEDSHTGHLNVAPCPTRSEEKNPLTADPFRIIYHRECSRGCICKDCHPDNGKYPYAEAVKDYEKYKDPAYRNQNNNYPMITNAGCDCYCDCVPPGSAGVPPASSVKKT